ncbi:hypothetical protein C0J52_20920 [Blattella germanica]|nr:hypothetical protein C0J52_20920 [Blattella germanica]
MNILIPKTGKRKSYSEIRYQGFEAHALPVRHLQLQNLSSNDGRSHGRAIFLPDLALSCIRPRISSRLHTYQAVHILIFRFSPGGSRPAGGSQEVFETKKWERKYFINRVELIVFLLYSMDSMQLLAGNLTTVGPLEYFT